MSFITEEDEDFGPPSSNSRLSSLFRDSLSLPSDNKALTYTAPKQPGKKQSQQVKHVLSSTDQEVLVAAAVTCYKLKNKKYEALQGKVGLALLGNHEKCSYSIILYLSKQKPISTTRINKDFRLISQSDNFCTFCDDSRQNWAILLDSNEFTQRFVSEINRILALLGAGPDPVAGLNETVAPVKYMEKASENLSDKEESSKTKLISRMAKLGQPILPLKGAAVAEDSDSDAAVPSSTEIEQESVKPKKPSRPEKPSLQKSFVQPVNENTIVNPMIVPASHYSFVNEKHAIPAIPYFAPSLPYSGPSAGGYTNYYESLLSETRTQNSEIRMHLCRLMDKIDHLAQRQEKPLSDILEFKFNFNKLLGQSSQQTEQLAELLGRSTSFASRSLSFNEAMQKEPEKKQLIEGWCIEMDFLKSTVDKLKEENDQLATFLHMKTEEHRVALQKIEQLQHENLKLYDGLIGKLTEQKETLERKHQQEIGELKVLINELKAKEEKLTSQQESALRNVKAKVKDNGDLINELMNEQEEKKRQLDFARQEATRVKEELLQANYQITGLNEELSHVKTELSNRQGQGSQAIVIDQVKTVMNKVYKEITKHFLNGETYSFKDIKSTVGAVIRDTTLKLLNHESDTIQGSPMIQTEVLRTTGESAEIANEETTRDVPDIANVSDEKSRLRQSETPSKFEELPTKGSCPATPVIKSVLEKLQDEIEEEKNILNSLDYAMGEDGSSEETNLPPTDDKEETKERSESLEETLQTSLAAANSRYNQGEPMWKPDPPPLPPLRNFDDDDVDD